MRHADARLKVKHPDSEMSRRYRVEYILKDRLVEWAQTQRSCWALADLWKLVVTKGDETKDAGDS